MARLHSNLGDRTVFTVAGLAKGQGLPVTVYEDPAGSVVANLAVYDPQNPEAPGAAIPGAAMEVDTWSNRPRFWDLNDRDVLYVTVADGPLEPIRPDAQPQITALVVRADDTDDRLDTLAAAVGGGGGGAGSGTHPGFTYTIRKTVAGATTTYTALRADGTTAATSTDQATPVRSGLRAVLTAVAADSASIYFPAGVYSFPEDPAGAEDHWAPNGIVGLALEGDPSGGTILTNWRDDSQPGYDTTPDVEPFSFTRCHRLRYRNFTVWAGGNIDSNNSSDATDFDGCHGVFVEGLRIERSRARGLVYDGGDTGADSRHSHVVGCEVWGVPRPLSVFAGSAGAVTAQEYRYVVTYVDSAYGETPPSEVTSYKADGTARMRLRLPTGPAYSPTKGVTARKVYRWSAGQPTWRLLATVADNTTTIYDDSATDASIAAAATLPLTGTPLIPAEGIKMLGSRRNLISGCEVVGVGSHGIQAVRKGSDAASNVGSHGHRILGNTIRRAGAGTATAAVAGVYVGGSSHVTVVGCNISNVGAVAAQGYGVYVQGLVGAATEDNAIGPNVIYDDQDASSPSGGPSTKYGVVINTAGGGTNPDGTVIVPGGIRGMVTGSVNDVTGANTKQYAETTHTHPPAAGGPAPVTIGWKSGLYYGARSSMAHGTLAGQALTANQVYGAPVYVPADVTVTTIACNVTAGVAGANLRMGIYTIRADGRPDTLVAGSDGGVVAAATTGDKSVPISAALTGGRWYWLAVLSDQAISVNGFTGGQPNLMGSIGPGSATKQSAARAAVGAGWSAMPATFPAPSDTAITLTTEVSF